MKSIKNHLSLVIALVSILFSIQILVIAERSIDTYKDKLANDYSIVVVSQKALQSSKILEEFSIIEKIVPLSPDGVIKRLDTGMSRKNIELLKLTLPKFYNIKLKYYPSSSEIKVLTEKLLRKSSITKVENYSNSHDSTYKLLLLFKRVITIFSVSMLVVTMLLIVKELRIWQFKHNERMNIMGLFGAPIWMRSAILFRLSIVDALIASLISFILFTFIASDSWVNEQFDYIGIKVTIFDPIYDLLILTTISIVVSIVLASLIVLGHKEEV